MYDTVGQLTGSLLQNVISINILKLTMTSQPPVVLDLVVGIDFLSDSKTTGKFINGCVWTFSDG